MPVLKFERPPARLNGRAPLRPGAGPGFTLSPRFLPLLALFAVGGLLLYTGMLMSKPLVFVFILAGWMISLCIHEFGHALAAWHGGDRTVDVKGYLSLDPMSYTHWQTSILFPMIMLAVGWIGLPGGAVFIAHRLLRSRGWESFVALAGPLGTLACLALLVLPLWLGLDETAGSADFWAAWHMLAYLEVSALVLNLLPIPGFDGFGVISPWLPQDMQRQAQAFAQISGLIFFGLLVALPSVNYALFNMIENAASPMGIDFRQVVAGFQLFQFWK